MYNLIVGTGVLALPAILAQAGWGLGVLFLFLVRRIPHFKNRGTCKRENIMFRMFFFSYITFFSLFCFRRWRCWVS